MSVPAQFVRSDSGRQYACTAALIFDEDRILCNDYHTNYTGLVKGFVRGWTLTKTEEGVSSSVRNSIGGGDDQDQRGGASAPQISVLDSADSSSDGEPAGAAPGGASSTGAAVSSDDSETILRQRWVSGSTSGPLLGDKGWNQGIGISLDGMGHLPAARGETSLDLRVDKRAPWPHKAGVAAAAAVAAAVTAAASETATSSPLLSASTASLTSFDSRHSFLFSTTPSPTSDTSFSVSSLDTETEGDRWEGKVEGKGGRLYSGAAATTVDASVSAAHGGEGTQKAVTAAAAAVGAVRAGGRMQHCTCDLARLSGPPKPHAPLPSSSSSPLLSTASSPSSSSLPAPLFLSTSSRPRLKFDMDTAVKLIVYTGIGWLAAFGCVDVFEYVGV